MNRNNSVKNLIIYRDFLLIDIICLPVSFVLASFFANGGFQSPFLYENNVFLLKVMVACQFFTLIFSNNYERILSRGPYEELIKIIRFTTIMTFNMLVYLFAFQLTEIISRLQVGWTLVIYVVLDSICRHLNKKRIKRSKIRGWGRQYAMMVATTGDHVDRMMERLLEHSDGSRKITGIIVVDRNDAAVRGEYKAPLLHPDDDVMDRIQKGWVDEVFCLQPEEVRLEQEILNSLVDMGVTVHVCPERLNDIDMPLTEVNELGGYTVLTSRLRFVPLDQIVLKRIMDVIGGIVGCLITLVLTVIIGPAIYLKSPGPIFFAQERIGRSGKKFKMYKFRSMYMDAEERKAELMEKNKMSDGMMFKLDDDPRIIGSEKKDKEGKPRGIGNFIRNTSIDEFPQFWNVLRGDMSLVGTRPPLPEEWERYNPHHRARMTVKPGITGLWQISGRSEITDFEEVVKLDLEYIETWDIQLDIKIILKTIGVVVKRRGAS